jgi:hypothetical protein
MYLMFPAMEHFRRHFEQLQTRFMKFLMRTSLRSREISWTNMGDKLAPNPLFSKASKLNLSLSEAVSR